jgi:hypothetical protein
VKKDCIVTGQESEAQEDPARRSRADPFASSGRYFLRLCFLLLAPAAFIPCPAV